MSPANDAPVATGESNAAGEDTPPTVPSPGILANDADGDPLAAVLVSGPEHGALSLNPDGSITYTPEPDFDGPDQFTYQVSDGDAHSNVVTTTLDVGGANDAPVAVDESYTKTEDTPLTVAIPGVLGNDTDVDGDPPRPPSALAVSPVRVPEAVRTETVPPAPPPPAPSFRVSL